MREALDALAEEGSSPGSATHATALLRATRDAVAAAAKDDADRPAWRALLHRVLEAAMDRPVREAFDATPFGGEWTDLLLEAVRVSDFAVGPMFLARARGMGDRTLFLLPPDRRESRISWAEASATVHAIGRALLELRARGEIGPGKAPVAMLSANSPDVALFDLACLVTGTPNVPVPANSPPAQIAWILRHSGAAALLVGDPLLARNALEGAGGERPARVHWLDPERDPEDGIGSFAEFLSLGEDRSDEEVRTAAAAVRSSDLATTMYTSGTTGDPKGVPFTQANLVTKRFARAAAWPDLGEGDVFLCYLPLYHTFGRWLEMLGCVFWGAVYAFVDDASVESLLYSFQRARPTTFISVPKKWLQIAEAVAPLSEDAEPDPERDRRITRDLVRATGGRLKRGLSAAGYLPPTVFRRFHAAGIELHSGFGMTEATGGITMTPAGDYRDDSIGVALPGIELKVADDGELLIRGPYVTPPAEGEEERPDGWFASGDIVTADAEGHLKIVDRKKEIFKNVQGETISPRRVESLFAGFDPLERVLLVGDRRDYCTVLIVPTAELRELYADSAEGPTLESPELRETFAPIVSTVNRFLAPYERIVDFAVLARDLDAERGELTAKGTPKRKLVTERFRDAIEPMYSREKATLQVGDVTVSVPHWVLRQTGVHSRELRPREGAIEVATTGRRLAVHREPDGIRVGDLVYDPGGPELGLGEILGRAELWLGNDAIREFAGHGIEHWWRRGRRFQVRTRLVRRPPFPAQDPADTPVDLPPGPTFDIPLLHRLARALRRPDPEDRREIVALLGSSLTGDMPDLDGVVRDLLRAGVGDPEIRAECLRALTPGFASGELDAVLAENLDDPDFLSPREIDVMADAPLRSDQLDRLVARAGTLAADGDESGLVRLQELLLRQALDHPDAHLRVRSLLAALVDEAPRERREARQEALRRLVRGFRGQLAPAVPAEGTTWEQAVEFVAGVEPEHRERIVAALRDTPLLAEAATLLGGSGAPVAPEPLGPAAIRVTFLGTGTGRAVCLLQWRAPGEHDPGFECVLKVNRDLAWADVQDELRLLVRARSGASGRPVVKTQGGGWPEQGLWTEEFIPGETLDRLVERLAEEPAGGRSGGEGGRLPEVWPFVVSSCASLVVDFWNRTGRAITLAHPSPAKIVLPAHDWQVGGRLVSIADRRPCDRLLDILAGIRTAIVQPLRERYRNVALEPEWPLLLSAAFEVLGQADGDRLLARELPRGVSPGILPEESADELVGAAYRFVSSVRRRGFLPSRIRIAARRYRRWAQINPGATLEARASTIDQLEEAYGLGDLEQERPGSRLQLFRHTVFRGAGSKLTRALDDVIARQLAGDDPPDAWRAGIATLRESLRLEEDEEFFLARMLFPHVDPRARAVLTREEDLEGALAAGVEVEQLDASGDVVRIRRPANPNETNALYRIFRASYFQHLPSFGDLDLLIATDGSGRVIGGLILRRTSETFARLLWIVVSRHRRGRGIGSLLVQELLDRLRAQGVEAVATGFFRPSFFAKFGFGVDPRYAGLVRQLADDRGETAGS
jgi:long-subunit acyl-CoA synthetase (AMP-forming)/GNAT superfamily N-acetyltransferase